MLFPKVRHFLDGKTSLEVCVDWRPQVRVSRLCLCATKKGRKHSKRE